jgi:hypothetical protein
MQAWRELGEIKKSVVTSGDGVQIATRWSAVDLAA